MNITVLINAMSGSVPANADTAIAKIIEDAGHTLRLEAASGADICEITPSALAEKPDMVIVWGGDGTTACVLNAAGQFGPPVLALPGGSMNLVHKRLHRGNLDWESILEDVLANPEPEAFSAGVIGEHRFYVAAMLGRLTKLTDAREAVRRGAVVEAAQALTSAEALDLKTRLTFKVEDSTDAEPIEAAAGALVVAGNRWPRFEIAVINPDSVLDLMAIGLESWIKGWREAEAVETNVGRKVSITELKGRAIPATFDGELTELSGAVTAHVVPNAARVLRARASG